MQNSVQQRIMNLYLSIVADESKSLIRDLVEGEFNNPVRIVAFNIAEGWCRDVTVDIADELRRRVVEYGEISQSAIQFLQVNQR
jgi:hypothetical protein